MYIIISNILQMKVHADFYLYNSLILNIYQIKSNGVFKKEIPGLAPFVLLYSSLYFFYEY